MSPARPDLSARKPWRAEPTDPSRPESDWQVVAPPRHGGKTPCVVASFLSEEDARLIAAAPTMQRLLEELIGGSFDRATLSGPLRHVRRFPPQSHKEQP